MIALKNDFNFGQLKEKIAFLANVSAAKENEKYPLLNGETPYYVCKNHACLKPTNEFPMYSN